ncbi:PIN domain-containing protein [Candidatus Palauibacter sp.]|uniref:PIN domain-containing protein n=1 Tax=Candidatus Palauibacter sp. TaxID=3101350 RepID=UPI003B01D6A0
MGTLIDTSVLVAVERDQMDLDSVIGAAREPDDPLAMAAITASELLQGVQAAQGIRRVAAERSFETWLAVLPVVPFDLEVARVHAVLAEQLGRRGTPIGAHDLIIAATAVSGGYRVATRDRRSFARIDGLEVEYW